MTIKSYSTLSDEFQDTDPQNWVDDLLDSISAGGGSSLILSVTHETSDGTIAIGTIPANSLITDVFVIRTEAWSAITTFEVGKSGDTDWLVTTVEADVTTAITSGEEGEVERVADPKFVTSSTAVILTLDNNSATTGEGYVLVRYTDIA